MRMRKDINLLQSVLQIQICKIISKWALALYVFLFTLLHQTYLFAEEVKYVVIVERMQ